MNISSQENFENNNPKPKKKTRFEDEFNLLKQRLTDEGIELSSIEGLEEIANFYLEHHKYIEALRMANDILTLIPYSSDAWMRKGMILNNMRRHNEALECFSQASTIDPTDAFIYINR